MGQSLQPLEDGNHRLVGEPGNVIVKENYWIRTKDITCCYIELQFVWADPSACCYIVRILPVAIL